MTPNGTWRLLTHPGADGAWNMAVDEAILTRCARSREPVAPTLRLYGWSPPALSLGRSQACGDWPALDRLRSEETDLVRRPSGGRAVLHDQERTYSVVGRLGMEAFPGGVVDTYRRIAAALVRALRSLGAAVHSEHRDNGGTAEPGRHCFAAASAHEILWEGRKLVGSAQLRRRRAFLQHGSIMLRSEPVRLGRLMGDPGARGNVADLEQVLGRAPETAVLDRALISAFEESFRVPLRPEELTTEEAELAVRLRCWKYDSASWTLAGRLGARERRWGPLRAG